jgi:RNA polymerase sigma-70 factor (ECF subfamily)
VQEKPEIANAWKQDESAFENLFKSYYKPLCAFANRYLQEPEEAEEIVQQTFVSLWEKRSDMTINTSVKSYLYRSVHNASLNRIRHNKTRQLHAAEQLSVSKDSVSGEDSFHLNELQTEISRAIETLPEQCRIVFKLSRYENLKYAEIAKQLGISIKTVEAQMGKALRVLREQLRDYMMLVLIVLMHNS